MRQIQQVRRLLIAGKSVSSIARLLSMTRYRVNKLVEKLIETNMTRGRSRSKLIPYDPLIRMRFAAEPVSEQFWKG